MIGSEGTLGSTILLTSCIAMAMEKHSKTVPNRDMQDPQGVSPTPKMEIPRTLARPRDRPFVLKPQYDYGV
jgi:hypothetical protein